MVRSLVLYSIIGTTLLGMIVYIARPEVIDAQAKAVMAPITKILDDRKAEKYRQAKEDAYNQWMSNKFRLSADCVNPQTALKATECKNKKDQLEIAFEQHWRQKINSGWVPD